MAEYCPDCATVVSKISEREFYCSRCNKKYDINNLWFVYGSAEPPNSPKRCPQCKAYTFNYPSSTFGDDTVCRRCKYPNPNKKMTTSSGSAVQQSGAYQQPPSIFPTYDQRVKTPSTTPAFWNYALGGVTGLGSLSEAIFLLVRPQNAQWFLIMWLIQVFVGFLGTFLTIKTGTKFSKWLCASYWIALPIMALIYFLL